MLNLLKYLDARGGESGTWSAIAAALVMLHLKVDPVLWGQITLWGAGVAAALGVVLKEAGTKPATAIAVDALVGMQTAVQKTPLAAVALAAVALGLAACGQQTQAVAYESAVGLTAVEQTELQYVNLPRCPATAGLCSDPGTVTRLKQLDAVAYAAVKRAEASGASADAAAANAAIAAIQAAIPTMIAATK